jgi:hypothetical protein
MTETVPRDPWLPRQGTLTTAGSTTRAMMRAALDEMGVEHGAARPSHPEARTRAGARR